MSFVNLSGQVDVAEALRALSTGTEYSGRIKAGPAVVVLQLTPRPGLDELLSDLEPWQGYLHPRVGGTLGYGQLAGHRVAVFQPPQGKPLSERVPANAPIPGDLALRVVRDVAEALIEPHSRGIGCGGVEPGNVFFDGTRATLTRLGCGRIAALADGLRLPFGHPTYLAPEVLQLQQRLPSAASDVYALGVLFYELIAGRPPFTGDVQQVLRDHLQKPLPPPKLDGSLSLAAAGLLLRMLAKTPEERVRSAGDVFAAANTLLTPKPLGSGTWGTAARRVSHGESEPTWSVSTIPAPPAQTSTPDRSVSERIPRSLMESVETMPPPKAAAGQYSLSMGDTIARGPVGRSYQATFNGEPVIVKAISSKFKDTPILTRFKKLCPQLTQLAHANVVNVKKFITNGDRLLVIMDPAGSPLSVDGPIPTREAIGIIAALANGLGEAAALGLHHGDIRPAKVYVGSGGEIRLADFGFAEAACAAVGFPSHGLPFGHPAYLAAEVFQERLVAPTTSTDVYALGILFYQLLTGRAPFQGDVPSDVLKLQLTSPLPPPPQGVSIPAAVAELVLSMTAKKPSRRPQSFSEILESLAACRDSLDTETHAKPSQGPAEVEEFDPSASLTSQGEWEKLVGEATSTNDSTRAGWSADKITSGLDATNMEGDGLRKAVEAARKNLAGRSAGKKRAPQALAGRQQVDSAGLVKAAVGLVCVVLLAGWIVITREEPEPKTKPRPTNPVSALPRKPVESPVDPELDKALYLHISELRRTLNGGRLEEAASYRKGFKGQEALSAKQRISLQAAEAEFDAAIKSALNDRRETTERLLRLRLLAQVEDELKEIKPWGSSSSVYTSYVTRLTRQRDALDRELVELGVKQQHSLEAVGSRLSSKLQGWAKGGTILHGGGVTLKYVGGKKLARDLVVAQKAKGSTWKPGAVPFPPRPALLLSSPRRSRLILKHALELARPVSVTLDFVLASSPVQGSRFAVLVGCGSSKRPSGKGTEWGISAVELKAKQLTALNAQPLPGLETKRVMRLELRFVPAGKGKVRLKSSLVDHLRGGLIPGGEAVVETKSLAGHVALVVEGAKLWITRFEVRGVLPRKALR